MIETFSGIVNAQELNIANFNTRNVIDMYGMFKECSSITLLTFGPDFKTDLVEDMESMFDKSINWKV